jgi:hypothetical protein
MGQKKLKLHYLYICSSRTFLPLFNIKADLVSLVQGFESFHLDRGMMDEYIRTILLLDKTKTLLIAEPLYSSISHSDISFSLQKIHTTILAAATLKMEFRSKTKPAHELGAEN